MLRRAPGSPRGFADSTLVLAAHGSSVGDDAAAAARIQVERLRQRPEFARVEAGFWIQEPRVTAVVADARTPRVFVVPLMMSEGYFSQQVLPRELGLEGARPAGQAWVQDRGSQRLYYCPPIGTHPALAEVIAERARQVTADHPIPDQPSPAQTALVLVGHGTPRNPKSRRAIEDQAARLRSLNEYGEVLAVFMEEPPRVQEIYRRAQCRFIVVVPCLVSDGPHVREDIPVMLGRSRTWVEWRRGLGLPSWENPTARKGKLVWYTSSVGAHSAVADVIIQRVREAADQLNH